MSAQPDMSALGRLVPVTAAKVGDNTVPTCNARELHCYLEVKRDFSNWIKGRIAKYGFAEGADYALEDGLRSPNLASTKSRVQRVMDYYLTLDMAKELAMVENNPKGREVRRYFIECEKIVSSAKQSGAEAILSPDADWAKWLSLSTDERRTRQRDVLIYKQAHGAVGMRIAMYHEGMPGMPAWAIGVREQHELDLLKRPAEPTVTVTVTVPGAG